MFPLRLHLKTIAANGSLIVMVARDDAGARYTVQVPFRPFFYVPRKDEAIIRKRGLEYEEGPPALDDEPTFRVYVDTPDQVMKRRKGFSRTYEADVPYTRRFLVDSGIKDGFILHRGRVLGEGMVIASIDAIEPVEHRNDDRQFLFDIETNKPEGSRHYSPATIAKGAVTVFGFHDTFDGTNVHTHVWHPARGHKGRPRVEVRNRFSQGFGKDVDWYVHWYGSEEELFEGIIGVLRERRPDALSAWNGAVGWKTQRNQGGFDVPYLVNRARNLGISPGLFSPMGNAFAGYRNFGKVAEKGRWACHVDGVQLIDSMTSMQVKDGGFTASVPYSDLKRVLMDKTKDRPQGPMVLKKEKRASTNEWWLEDVDSFLEYSFDDVDAQIVLERSEGYTEWIRNLQQFVGVEDANRLFTPMALISTLNLRIAKEDGVVVPTAGQEVEDENEDYSAEGGFVLDPQKTGLQDNVAILDLDAMYVAIIISGNISWETWVKDPPDESLDDLICLPSDLGPQFFLKPTKKVGLMPKSCMYLRAARKVFDDQIKLEKDADRIKALKKARDPAKQLLLAVYGTSLSDYFSLFRPEAGSSITGMGRFVIKGVDRLLRSKGHFVQYSDTDSVFVPLTPDEPGREPDEEVVQRGLDLCDAINDWFDGMAASLNIDEHTFHIGMEALGDPFVQGAQKKQYAMYVCWAEGHWQKGRPKMLLKGVPGIKGDAARITRETTETVVRMMLNRCRPVEILDYVRDVYEDVLAGEYPLEDLVKAITLNVLPDETPKNPHYVHEAAKVGKREYDMQYNAGAKVSLVRLKGIEGLQVAIPEGEDIPEKMLPVVDWDAHAMQTVLTPLRGIMSWIGLEKQLESIRVGSVLTKTVKLA